VELIPLIAPGSGRRGWKGSGRSGGPRREKLTDGGLRPGGNLIRKVRKHAQRDDRVPDVGLNQIWTVRTWQTRSPRGLLTSGGIGTMGFSVPPPSAPRLALPISTSWSFAATAAFYMNIQELATISTYGIRSDRRDQQPAIWDDPADARSLVQRPLHDEFLGDRSTWSRWLRGSASRRSGSPWTRTRQRRSPDERGRRPLPAWRRWWIRTTTSTRSSRRAARTWR